MLKNRKSAGKLRIGETSTTIPLEGSTLQVIGNGSEWLLTGKAEEEDIVCAYRKL